MGFLLLLRYRICHEPRPGGTGLADGLSSDRHLASLRHDQTQPGQIVWIQSDKPSGYLIGEIGTRGCEASPLLYGAALNRSSGLSQCAACQTVGEVCRGQLYLQGET